MNRVETSGYCPQGYPEYYRPLDRRARQRRLGETVRRMGAITMLVATTTGGWFTRSESPRMYPHMTETAQTVAQEYLDVDTQIECAELPESYRGMVFLLTSDGGATTYPERKMYLSTDVCRDLGKLATSDPATIPEFSTSQIDALSTVLHEEQHVRGDFDEARVECDSRQLIAGWLLDHHVDDDGVFALRDHFSVKSQLMPAKYTSPECRIGGELDRAGGTLDGRRTSNAVLPIDAPVPPLQPFPDTK